MIWRLRGYKLALYTNGSTDEHSDRKIEFTGSLAPNQSFVVYNDSADDAFKTEGGVASEVTFFNGDDAIVLSKNGAIVDSIGRIGEDPGSAWEGDGGFSTANKTLRRANSVTMGDDIADDEFPGAGLSQWVVFDSNTADGLGCPGESACDAVSATNTIIITEYVEGSGSNKAVEISNLGTEDVDLGAGKYKLALFGNGDTTEHETRKIEFTGVLKAGASFVAYNDSAEDQFKFTDADKGAASEVTFYNGDDALVLTRDGEVVDSFGRVGEDPGSEWTDANNPDWSTANKTLRRKASITTGDTVNDDEFPGSDNQWLVFDINTADGLGCPGEGACVEPTEPNYILITEYVEGSGSNKAVEISNIGDEDVDLGAAKYKLALYGNGDTTEHETRKIEFSTVLKAGESFVAYNDSADDQFKFTDPEKGAASEVTFFNGDDALVLTRDGEVVDSFGRVGEDPGSAWTDANNPDWSTANKTLRRMANITSGDTAISDEFPGTENQWLVFDSNTWDGLGCVGEEICAANVELPANTIIISEYVEGFGNNRAVEITNVGTETVDLGAYKYKLAVYTDGSMEEHESRKLELTGTLAAGASFVAYNGGAMADFKPVNGAASEVAFFDGNDAIVLSRWDGEWVDVFGRVGDNPGEAWMDANNADWSTKNKTLRRLASVTMGDADGSDDFPGEANQWLAVAANTADGLGCGGEAACNTGGGDGGDGGEEPTGPGEGIIMTEYVEGTGNNKVIEINNISAEPIDMGAEQYKVALYPNGEMKKVQIVKST